MRMIRFLIILFLFQLLPAVANGQSTAVKTNLLYWTTASMNVDVETRFSDHWSGEISVGYNPFTFGDNKKIKHIAVQPEVRYWLNKPFAGNFLAMNAVYSHFNAGGVEFPLGVFPSLKDYRYQGNLGGIGIGYGYNLTLNPRWSIEFEATVGVMVADYKKYKCKQCGTLVDKSTKAYVMPTKIAINMVYYLKSR